MKKRLRYDFHFSLKPHSLFPYYMSLQDHILLLRGVDQIHIALIVTSLHMGIMCVSWFTFLPHTLDLLETWPMLYIAFEPVHCYSDYVGSIKTESGNLVTEIKDTKFNNQRFVCLFCHNPAPCHRSVEIFVNFS